MQMQVVKARKSHLQDVLEVIYASRDHLISIGISQWDNHYPNEESVLRDLTDENLYIAALADSLVGTIAFSQDQEPEYTQIQWFYPGPCLVIHRLCVSPSHQGRGVGSSLMRFAEEYAKVNRFNSLRLDVYTGNPDAVNFYKNLGYEIVGQVMFPRRTLPFYCMEKDINPTADST
ncbi:MAG: GNAT family N-acetyltransferase [Congregibacter sp.]|nr:GNAT family N-acetyltransferase [Congregibacter sp.]